LSTKPTVLISCQGCIDKSQYSDIRSLATILNHSSLNIGGLALFAASLLLVTTIYYFPSMADTKENFTVEDTAAVSVGLGKFTASLYQVFFKTCFISDRMLKLIQLQVVAKTLGSSENVFISPFSVAAVSTLALVGARGNTAQQMKNTLHVNNIDDSKLSGIVGKIVKSIKV